MLASTRIGAERRDAAGDWPEGLRLASIDFRARLGDLYATTGFAA